MQSLIKRMFSVTLAAMMLAAALLLPVGAESKWENLFKVAAPGIPSDVSLSTAMKSSKEFYTSSPIAVNAGDVLYFGPCVLTQEWYMIQYGADGRAIAQKVTLSGTGVSVHEKISDTLAILCYKVPLGVSYVCMITPNEFAKTTVMTANEPFSYAEYGVYIRNIDTDAGIPVDEDSVLRGKRILFIGDSITGGSYDVMHPSTGKAYAGRIAVSTGAEVVNCSVGGATITPQTDKSWLHDQLTSQKGEDFDVIVIHAGGNDAKRGVGIGTPLSTPSDRINTFAAHFQYLIATAKEQHPNAKLFYIAAFQRPSYKFDISEYYAMAKQICEQYDVHYIDLYNHEELNAKLMADKTFYFPDLVHPTTQGYDIITPYVQGEIEQVMKEIYGDPLQTEQSGTEKSEVTVSSTVQTDVQTKPQTEAPSKDGTDAIDSTASKKGCSSTVMGGMAMLFMYCGAGVILKKRKTSFKR